MKIFNSFIVTLLFIMPVYSQEILTEILPSYSGLTKDVVEVEEIIYTYNEAEKKTDKYQISNKKFEKGKLILERNEFFGDYPSVSKTTYTYDTKGFLIKRIYQDESEEMPTTSNYTYEKGLLKHEAYESPYNINNTFFEYNSNGTILKETVKDDTGEVTNITEYSDYQKETQSYTRKDIFYSGSEISSSSVSKYKNGRIISYETYSDYSDNVVNSYEYDAFGNLTNIYYNNELSGNNKYEYSGDNFIKKYYFEDFSLYQFEQFTFRKITFLNGNSIGSSEADLAFIEKHNVIDKESDLDVEYAETGCTSGDCENGYGTYNYENGESYEGFFKDGNKNGPGILLYEDGSNYNGMWQNGEKSGLGLYTDIDGTLYFGYHEKNLRQGYGFEQLNGENGAYFNPSTWDAGNEVKKLLFEPTYLSNGCLSGDCTDGFGQYLYDNGDIYLGYFKNGLYDKMGMYVYKEGDVFIGEFKDHKRAGYGMYVWLNGSVYYGQYKNDTYHGLGAYLPIGDEQKLIGEFKDGNLSKSMLQE